MRTAVLPLLALITVAAFFPVLQNGFVDYDDQGYLTQNAAVRGLGLSQVRAMFFEPVQGEYTPLVALSFAVENALAGLDPRVYHATNLLLHAANVWLVYWVLGALGAGAAVRSLAALIFAVHPVHTEAVAWVTARKDVLYAFFYLLSLGGWLAWRRAGRERAYAASLLFFVLALLSKPMAISLPVLLFAHEWAFAPGPQKKWTRLIPFFVLAAAAFVFSWNIIHKAFEGIVLDPGAPPVFVLHLMAAPFFYLFKLIWPARLSALYPPALDAWDLAGSALAAVFAVMLMKAAWSLRSESGGFGSRALFAAAFFFIAFLPAFPVLKVTLSPVADRYAYVASVGWCWLMAEWLARMASSLRSRGWARRAFMALIACAMLSYSALSWTRSSVWHDTVSLWDDVLTKYPQVELAYLNRGEHYRQAGLTQKALADYDRSIAIKPDRPQEFNNRGVAFLQAGNFTAALADFERAAQLDPGQAGLFMNRAAALEALGRSEEAHADRRHAEALLQGNG